MTKTQGISTLSPAAQAVLDAFWKQPGDRSAIAAAIRAAADRAEDLIGDTENPKFTEGVLAAAHFLDLIAAELAQSYDWQDGYRNGLEAKTQALAA